MAQTDSEDVVLWGMLRASQSQPPNSRRSSKLARVRLTFHEANQITSAAITTAAQ